jgi:hypothetical protein
MGNQEERSRNLASQSTQAESARKRDSRASRPGVSNRNARGTSQKRPTGRKTSVLTAPGLPSPFNTADLDITNVSGLGNVQRASCSFCHDAPNLESRSVVGALDTGTSHEASVEADGSVWGRELSFRRFRVYQIRGCTDPTTHLLVTHTTSDPGAGLLQACAPM